MFYNVQYRKSMKQTLIESNLNCYLIFDLLAKILSKSNGFSLFNSSFALAPELPEVKHSILYLYALLVMTKMRETQRQIWLLNAL